MDKRISDLTSINSPADSDLVPVVNMGGTEPVTSKVTVANLRGEPKPIAIANKQEADVLGWDSVAGKWKNLPFLTLLSRFFNQVHSAVTTSDSHPSKVTTFTGAATSYVPEEAEVFLVNTDTTPNTLWRSTGTEAGDMAAIGGTNEGNAILYGSDLPSSDPMPTSGTVYYQYSKTGNTEVKNTWVWMDTLPGTTIPGWAPMSGYIVSTVDPVMTPVLSDFKGQFYYYYMIDSGGSTIQQFVSLNSGSSIWYPV